MLARVILIKKYVCLNLCLSVIQFTSVEWHHAPQVLLVIHQSVFLLGYAHFVPTLCIRRIQPCMFVCLQSLGTKGTLHPLPTLQNYESVPQVIETGCKAVLLPLPMKTCFY